MTDLVWIKHTPGPCPVKPHPFVWYRLRNGDEGARPSNELYWGQSGQSTITHYCPIPEPRMPDEPPREREAPAVDPITERRNAFWREMVVAMMSWSLMNERHLAENADAMLAEAIKRGRV